MPYFRSFNWRVLLMRLLINAAGLLLTAALVPKIYFADRSLVSLLLVAVALGLLNAIVKPIIQVLTLRFIFASYGIIVILINTFILWLLSFLLPQRFAVDGFLWAFVGGALIGLLTGFFENLLGVAPPVVGDRYIEARSKLKEEQGGGMVSLLMRPLSGSEPEALPSAPDTAAIAADDAPIEVVAPLGNAAEASAQAGADDSAVLAAARGEA
jgi:putative membrane protein